MDVLPVIHPGALEMPIGDLESERFDQVQLGSGGGAEARDVARVRWDLGLEQDDAEC
jgi:hypothetical protein